MHRSLFGELYPTALLGQYTASHNELKSYVLSPATFVNHMNEAIICKDCLSELEKITKKRSNRRHPPKQGIANGYIIGDAPVELTKLNDVELSLISRARTYCQTWMFFAGCHQHIKGWHTFFKNRPSHNVGNLTMLTDSGHKGVIMVFLCGPFTTTQKALSMKQMAVDPQKVVAAWIWLKANNFRYKDDEIPSVDNIPLPKVIEENL